MSQHHITIRKAELKDAALLAELGARAFREAFDGTAAESDLNIHIAEHFSMERSIKELSDKESIFLLASIEGEPGGYAFLKGNRPPPSRLGTDERALEIVRFYTLKKWWGGGVGPSLMDKCLQLARREGFAAIWLSSWKQNARGNAFYRKWRFKVVGEKAFTVGTDIQRDFIMARLLNTERS